MMINLMRVRISWKNATAAPKDFIALSTSGLNDNRCEVCVHFLKSIKLKKSNEKRKHMNNIHRWSVFVCRVSDDANDMSRWIPHNGICKMQLNTHNNIIYISRTARLRKSELGSLRYRISEERITAITYSVMIMITESYMMNDAP